MPMQNEVKAAKALTDSVVRRSQTRIDSYAAISDPRTKDALRAVVEPPDISRTLKKAGVALMIPPDPVTDVAGAALIGAAYALQSRKPLGLKSMMEETERTLRDLGSIF